MLLAVICMRPAVPVLPLIFRGIYLYEKAA